MCRVRIPNSTMIKLRSPPAPPVLMIFGVFYWVGIFGFFHLAQAQSNQPQTTTDPNEVRALNSIFGQWGISADRHLWNTSGDPCSGAAIDDQTILSNTGYNPFIKCGCSYNNGTLCHIQQLKVKALNVIGDIPAELWTLTFLTDLDLGQNYLTGPLSASIGNLTAMKYLDFGTNALSGELPKELGMLNDLRSLAIMQNNFSGPLPSQLGNLTELQELHISSSGVSGEIPSSFANLRNLVTVRASDIELTGMIPEFIGNWSNLETLRFQGNSFESPIPSSFSNLINLKELRISDLSNRSSSLEFITEMKSLSVLDLRNNKISDVIPSNIGEFQSLKYLDLSFNSIRGDIPDSLFNLSLMAYLFLGNNQLTGALPSQKSTSLLNIDVSYNYLTGSLPSWINEPNLQLNLVANSFTIEKSDSSVLSSRLNCLRRNFPCSRGPGIYYKFSINCGGPQIASSNGTVYERDDAPLGPASYFVSDSSRWGVSNVGFFTENDNPQYNTSVLSQFTNTPDSQLFETARISASSLRYYGLGLGNGIYTVTLQFAELVIFDNYTWQSHGRRVFDIYLQRELVSKDFDIKRVVGGISKRAVMIQFKAPVTENYLEIHLFWAGKGTCCIPSRGTYGPTISAISATADFIPTEKKNRSTGLIVGNVVGFGLLIFLFVITIFCIFCRRNKSSGSDDEDLQGIDARPYTFSYAELKTATGDFSPANKLGEGGFGPVYKGTLGDGRVIAVKQLSVTSHQGKSQFVAEIIAISAVQHRNLVKLYGCCIKGTERLLVYEYLENKSLDQALFGQKSLNLNWTTRYDICLGVARGLAYLHEESRLRIIHRDIKASNILLDHDFIPKISDFGLAKLYDDNKTHISTRVAGTIGYLAPEYAMRGYLSEKTDVFAFGVMALEIVSGKPNSDSSFGEEQLYLLEWAWQLYENKREVELVDSRLSEFNEEEVERMIGIALSCTQTLPSMRPTMSRAVAMLYGDVEVSKVTTKPGYLTDWKFDDITSFATDAETTKRTASYYATSSTNLVAEAHHSAENCTRPILHDIM